MTEEEFKALLKMRDGEYSELIIESEIVWTVKVRFDIKEQSKMLWASSTSKEIALEDVAHQYFRNKSANN